MARTEARIFTSIWDDRAFRDLSSSAQRLYLLLVSQPDLAQDGVIALRERRWGRMAAGQDTVVDDLAELEKARYVVVDDDAGELLVRSFIRRDGLYRQPNLLLAARRHLALVTSARIRQALAAELTRILTTADDLTDKTKALVVGMLEDIGEPCPNPSVNPTENASRSTRGEGSVVTAVTTGGSPLPAASQQLPAEPGNPSPAAPAAARQLLLDALESEACTTDEADALIALIERERRPRNLVAVLRTIAAAGELPDLLAQARATLAEALARDRASAERQRQAHDRAEANRAAIAACRLCDDRGYAGALPCPHDPATTDRTRRGAALARAALAADPTVHARLAEET